MSAATVLILEPIHAIGFELLTQAGLTPVLDPAPDATTLARASAIITRIAPVDRAMMMAAQNCQVVAKHGIGLNAVDLVAAAELGLPVVNTPDANARSTAEHALALILALARQIVPLDGATRQGDFDAKYRLPMLELGGRCLGLVGLGKIAGHLARMAGAGLGMRVIAFSPNAPDSRFDDLGVERADRLEDLMAMADIISLHVPARPDSVGMIDAAALACCRPGALLINTGRGEVVVEADLVAALRQGILAGAGLDVFQTEPLPADHPLTSLPNIVLTPHVGGSSDRAMVAMARGVAEQVVQVLAGQRPPHLATPSVWERRRISAS